MSEGNNNGISQAQISALIAAVQSLAAQLAALNERMCTPNTITEIKGSVKIIP